MRALLTLTGSCFVLAACATAPPPAPVAMPTPSPAPVEIVATPSRPALPTNVPRCDAPAWLRAAPKDSDDWLYGVGAGPSSETARGNALTELASRREVSLHAELADRQVEWQATTRDGVKTTGGGGSQVVSQDIHTTAEGRFRGCVVQESCVDTDVHTLLRCAHPGREMERALVAAGTALGKSLPKKAALIVIPATNGGGWITGFGEYAARVLRQALDASLPPGAALRSVPRWDPANLHEVARKYKATHALQAEHLPAGGARVRFAARLIDLLTEQPVPRSEVSFEIDLEPEQQDLMTVLGPLFPNKDAWALVANHGRGLDLRVRNTDLREGDEAVLSFSLPKDAYVYLFDVYEDGRAALVVPNPALPDNLFRGGKKYEIPDASWRAQQLSLLACPMPGRLVSHETLKLVAAPHKLDLAMTKFKSADMVSLQGGPDGNIGEVRALVDRLLKEGEPIMEGAVAYQIRAVSEHTRCKDAGGN